MHFYDLDTTFTFGKHQGQTVAQVLATQPDYLTFCVKHLDRFALRRADVAAWQEQFPALRKDLTTDAWATIDKKEAALNAPAENDHDDRDSYESYSADDAERDTFDALTDGQYGDYDDWNGDMDSLRDAMGY